MTQLFLDNNMEIDLSKRQIQKINDINEIQMHLLETIQDHTESLNTIEDNLSNIDNNLSHSIKNLESADKNYMIYTPIIIGSVVGAILVSPVIGLVGLKTGTLASLTGGIIGGISGYKIQ